MPSNSDLEAQISQGLPTFLRQLGILPQGYRCDVQLRRGDRKKRSTAGFEENWDPDKDSVRIAFAPVDGDEVAADEILPSPGVAASAEGRLSDLLRALARAENRPGYDFVSLKWFRDSELAREAFSWASDDAARHDLLREAIDRRWILTSKVANPRPPNFPVTAIRLNRQLPEVNAALGEKNSGAPVFRPIKIRGESLSATVLHDRR